MAPSGSPQRPDLERELQAPYRVDVTAVLAPFLRGGADPAALTTPEGAAWRTARTPDGVATLRLSAQAHAVRCAAWGQGSQWAIDHVPALLGFDDDPSGFPAHELPSSLAQTWRRYGERWRVPASGRVLEALVVAVLEQKVTGIQSRRAWASLLRELGEPAPGPTPRPMHVFPEPARVRLVPSWQWHRWGVPPAQSATILAAASAAGRLEQCVDLPAEQARLRLGAFHGIGPWTIAEVAQRALGDADAVSFGDYHLANHVVYAFTGGMRGTDEEMAGLLQPFAGHRYRVQRIVELSGVARPARGPRMTIADHRRH